MPAKALLVVVGIMVTTYAAKAVMHPRRVFVAELLDPHRAPGLGAWCMCNMMLASWPIAPISHTLALLWLALAAGAALAVTATHLTTSYRKGVPLEPSNFPATVSIALFPIICAKLLARPQPTADSGKCDGASLSHCMDALDPEISRADPTLSTLRDLAFFLGLVLATALTPPVVRRLCASRTHTANPSIWPLMAPWALLSAAWYTLAQANQRNSPEFVGAACALLAVVMMSSTLGFACVRRHAIRATFFSPQWAFFTFPTCTNAISLLRYARRNTCCWDPRSRDAQEWQPDAHLLLLGGLPPLAWLGVLLCAIASIVSISVALLTLAHLPRWLRQGGDAPSGGAWTPLRAHAEPMHTGKEEVSCMPRLVEVDACQEELEVETAAAKGHANGKAVGKGDFV